MRNAESRSFWASLRSPEGAVAIRSLKKLFEMHKKRLDFLVKLSYHRQAVAGEIRSGKNLKKIKKSS